MKFELRAFQETAVEELASLLDQARYGADRGRAQAVGLTAPTGAGKTVIAAALIERVLFGTDDGSVAPDGDATFLWMTDMPQLNLQTQAKLLGASSLLDPGRLPILDSGFDEPELTAGRVYFLNTQKLGEKGDLVKGPSLRRRYPFWETVSRTIESGRHLYLVIDEAHRGMTEARDIEEANSIIQRFIKGVDGLMPPVPIVIGITATPERYQRVVTGSGRTVASHDVPPDEVQRSGLIKKTVATSGAGERQVDSMALLRTAADAWKQSTERWAAYHDKYGGRNGDRLVVPALVIQVENEDAEGTAITQTNLAAVVSVITDVVGALPDEAFAHAFGNNADLDVAGRKLRYVEPSRIAGDNSIRVVMFKTSLGTGWDCPRAEVMFSFRRAVDATLIAQTIGRMVRTPLARTIEEDERLNTVDVFLPHYDRAAVQRIIDHLRATGDEPIARSFKDRTDLVSYHLRGDSEDAVKAIEKVPSYTVNEGRSRQDIRRLIDLARALSKHGLDVDAYKRETASCADILRAHRARLDSDEQFKRAVNDEGEIVISRVEWTVAGVAPGTEELMRIPASEDAIRSLFAAAGRTLGGDVALTYVRRRHEEDSGSINVARLEAFALSRRGDVMTALNRHASGRIDDLFRQNGAAIDALAGAKLAAYNRIRGSAAAPTIQPIKLPEVIEITKGESTWAKHLYVNDQDEVSFTFNSWETSALETALTDDGAIPWLRNISRGEASVCVPWEEANTFKRSYPDFLVVRHQDGALVVDILDPHDNTRDDAVGKAKGLAKYARDHGHLPPLLGHIDLMAKVDGRLRRLHLETEQVRRRVDTITTLNELENLYKTEDP